ncbi:epoxide hydrolase 1-like [Chironomus tepperi]|uniref:epoxide hydrolase 1-like n=1 Tax=Chironomus tepperi TaxID=113505 RepID=UPI00391FBE8C
MTRPSDVIKFIIVISLSVFYSSFIAFALLLVYIFKKSLFEVKDRPNPPAPLVGNEFGVHKFANVNGIKLHYVEKGDPKNPLIVFVHGFPEFWYSWRHQIKEFSKDYWTIAIDQRGYGQSDKPSNVSAYHTDNMADDINALVKSLGREKFILIAHDWGAIVGFNYVYRYTDTLEKYIMIGGPTSGAIKKLATSSLKQFLMSWYICFFQMPLLPEIALRMQDLRAFDKMKLGTAEDVECFKYTFAKKGALTCPINYYRAIRVLDPDRRPPRPKNPVPGLYILGEYDKYISRETGPLAMKELDRLEFNIIKGANHFAQQHKPDETNRMIREFLDKK